MNNVLKAPRQAAALAGLAAASAGLIALASTGGSEAEARAAEPPAGLTAAITDAGSKRALSGDEDRVAKRINNPRVTKIGDLPTGGAYVTVRDGGIACLAVEDTADGSVAETCRHAADLGNGATILGMPFQDGRFEVVGLAPAGAVAAKISGDKEGDVPVNANGVFHIANAKVSAVDFRAGDGKVVGKNDLTKQGGFGQ